VRPRAVERQGGSGGRGYEEADTGRLSEVTVPTDAEFTVDCEGGAADDCTGGVTTSGTAEEEEGAGEEGAAEEAEGDGELDDGDAEVEVEVDGPCEWDAEPEVDADADVEPEVDGDSEAEPEVAPEVELLGAGLVNGGGTRWSEPPWPPIGRPNQVPFAGL
jgi:hypothetical protein